MSIFAWFIIMVLLIVMYSLALFGCAGVLVNVCQRKDKKNDPSTATISDCQCK